MEGSLGGLAGARNPFIEPQLVGTSLDVQLEIAAAPVSLRRLDRNEIPIQ